MLDHVGKVVGEIWGDEMREVILHGDIAFGGRVHGSCFRGAFGTHSDRSCEPSHESMRAEMRSQKQERMESRNADDLLLLYSDTASIGTVQLLLTLTTSTLVPFDKLLLVCCAAI